MRKHIVAVLLTVALLSAEPTVRAQPAAPAQKQPTIELQKWESPDKSFGISYPKGWEDHKADSPGAVLVFGNPQVGVNQLPDAMAVLVVEEAAPDFGAWAKALKQGLLKTIPSGKFIEEKTQRIAGTPAIRVVYDSKEENGPPYRCIQWFIPRGRFTYMISFTSEPTRYKELLPIEKAVAASFTIGGTANQPKKD